MLLALAAGIIALLVTMVAGLLYRQAPTRVGCPECGEATSVLQPPPLLRRTRLLAWRWCPACGWEGMGRKGPEWRPGRRPVAHDSGFHWGYERLPEDFGFTWARAPEPTGDAPPPHHPSGFVFGTSEEAREQRRRAHPSGFSWAGDAPPAKAGSDDGAPPTPSPNEAPDPKAHPSGFRWGGAGKDAPVFQWARRQGRNGPPGGFRFKEQA